MIHHQETTKVGKRGTIVIPSKLRRRFKLDEGAVVIAEDHGDGVLIRPAVTLAVEMYTPERRAEFLLSNSIDRDDYARACKEVRKMGLDPMKIQHHQPAGA